MAFSATPLLQDDGTMVFELEGRLDVKAAREAEEVLLGTLEEPADVVLDMTGLDYIASAGLRLIKRVHKMARESGHTMTVKNVNDDIMEVFEMTGFAAMMSIE